MNVSMDGLRKQLSGAVLNLRNMCEDAEKGKLVKTEELQDSINKVIHYTNILNCIYDDEQADFSDLSEIHVPYLSLVINEDR